MAKKVKKKAAERQAQNPSKAKSQLTPVVPGKKPTASENVAKTRNPRSKTENYKVGPGRPPKGTRWKKGDPSPNPKGRPLGAKNLAKVIEDAAGTRVQTVINGKKQNSSALFAAGMQLAAAAVRGDRRSIMDFMNWVDKMETRAAASRPVEFPFSDADIEIIKAIYARIQQNKTETGDA